METIRATLGITRRHLFCILRSPKLWAGILLILSSVWSLVESYAEAAWALGESVNIGILACNFSYPTLVLNIYLALLLVFSELPFRDSQQIAMITRGGKRAWFLSQILYVFAVSIGVIILISLVSVIILIGRLSFGNAWGRIITNASGLGKYDIPSVISASALSEFSPYKAIAWSLPVAALIMIAFGCVILSLNSLKSSVGTVVGALIVALTLIGRWMSFPGSRYFMLLDWSDFSTLNTHNTPKTPAPEFQVGFLTGMLVISIVIIIFRSRKNAELNFEEVI